jgi:hypothetical protein
MAAFNGSTLDDAPMSYTLASLLRNAAVSAAWHAANSRYGYKTDAAKDLADFERATARQFGPRII